MKLVIAGASGQLGRHVMAAATAAGHEATGLSRAAGVDLLTGRGLAQALQGADAVIDASATSSTRARDSIEFFGAATRNLLDAEKDAGVGHHVAISIIGAAKINANYYAGKKVQEELLAAQPGRFTLLHTTQFHEFVHQIMNAASLGKLSLVPSMRSQPVAAAEVAARLVQLAGQGPAGIAAPMAGPREENMADMVRRYLQATGQHRTVLQFPLPGAWGRGMRDGSLLPGSNAQLGAQSFEQWLQHQ